MRNRMKWHSLRLKTKNLIIRSISMSTAHSEHVNRMSECHHFNNNIIFFFGKKVPFIQAHAHSWLFTGSVERIKLIFSVCCRVTHRFGYIKTDSKVIFKRNPHHWKLFLRFAHFRSLFIGDKINCKQFPWQRRQTDPIHSLAQAQCIGEIFGVKCSVFVISFIYRKSLTGEKSYFHRMLATGKMVPD